MFKLIRSEPEKEPLFSAAHTTEARRAEAWLEAQFRRAEKTGGFTLDDVEITPVLAEVMLTTNTHNRRERKSVVDRLAQSNKDGRWVPGASTIRFDTARTLADGQHRLTMVVASARAAIMDVRFGVSEKVRHVLDSHGKRTGGDVLSIEKHANATNLAAAARLLRNFKNGHPRANVTLENDLCVEFVEDHPGLHQSVLFGMRVNSALRCSSAAATVAHYLISESAAPEAAVEEFFDRVCDGLSLTNKRDPIYVLRAYLQAGDFKGTWGASSSSAVLGAFINAWNAHKRGVKTQRVAVREGDQFPTVERWK